MKMRTFFCLATDTILNRDLAALAGKLRATTTVRVAWVQPRNFHVTVRFLGDIDPMLTIELERMVRPIAARTAPFPLTIDRLGAFPAPARARVIWAGGDAPPEFVTLTDQINRGLAVLGFPPARKETIAHITLGRVKGRPDRALARALSEHSALPMHILHVDRIILMESTLTPRGAEYAPLFSVPFTGGANAV